MLTSWLMQSRLMLTAAVCGMAIVVDTWCLSHAHLSCCHVAVQEQQAASAAAREKRKEKRLYAVSSIGDSQPNQSLRSHHSENYAQSRTSADGNKPFSSRHESRSFPGRGGGRSGAHGSSRSGYDQHHGKWVQSSTHSSSGGTADRQGFNGAGAGAAPASVVSIYDSTSASAPGAAGVNTAPHVACSEGGRSNDGSVSRGGGGRGERGRGRGRGGYGRGMGAAAGYLPAQQLQQQQQPQRPPALFPTPTAAVAAAAGGYIVSPTGQMTYYPPAAYGVGVGANAVSPDALKESVKRQVEYYFSIENLTRDFFLRSKMDSEGWISLPLIAGFNRVRMLTPDMSVIIDALAGSTVIEIAKDYSALRAKENPLNWVLPSAQPAASKGSEQQHQQQPQQLDEPQGQQQEQQREQQQEQQPQQQDESQEQQQEQQPQAQEQDRPQQDQSSSTGKYEQAAEEVHGEAPAANADPIVAVKPAEAAEPQTTTPNVPALSAAGQQQQADFEQQQPAAATAAHSTTQDVAPHDKDDSNSKSSDKDSSSSGAKVEAHTKLVSSHGQADSSTGNDSTGTSPNDARELRDAVGAGVMPATAMGMPQHMTSLSSAPATANHKEQQHADENDLEELQEEDLFEMDEVRDLTHICAQLGMNDASAAAS